MSRRLEQRESVIERLVRHLLETGLSQTSLRQLAGAAGVSDRMLLYYFETKTDVLAAVLQRVAENMSAQLDTALPIGQTYMPADLFERTVAFTQSTTMRPYMTLWIESIAAAARDAEPYKSISNAIAAGFLSWIDVRLNIEDTQVRRAMSAMLLAAIDGLGVLDVCADDEDMRAAIDAMSQVLKAGGN